jgi:hypothetical protein
MSIADGMSTTEMNTKFRIDFLVFSFRFQMARNTERRTTVRTVALSYLLSAGQKHDSIESNGG